MLPIAASLAFVNSTEKTLERPSDTFARRRVNDDKFLGEDASDENVPCLSYCGRHTECSLSTERRDRERVDSGLARLTGLSFVMSISSSSTLNVCHRPAILSRVSAMVPSWAMFVTGDRFG